MATVISSEVGGAMKYYPSVSYTYIVDSTIYTSDRISNMNFNTKNRSVAEEALKNYPLGLEIKVYYNSMDPSKALLEPGIETGNFLLLAFGLIVLAVPVFSVLFMKFEIKKASKSQ